MTSTLTFSKQRAALQTNHGLSAVRVYNPSMLLHRQMQKSGCATQCMFQTVVADEFEFVVSIN